ncbi:DUF4286 family protein [Panacibacter ginsenosidivorans]|uniref:DUF4286 family protein n=1 Tax=Panacibacter ginsenosidivorans TaxID=1813871 RepID=A0A5B8V7T0_9BACT|nr:DUF4286 family protein [Panacibacter ginsenosidivorans]QEC67590.1 DUF4286 family protein [Panacibacter ginsenosidivorans]
MIIYNVTTHVNHTIHEAWLTWMKQIHIPEVMQTKCFIKFQMIRMLEVDETEGATYAVQYYAESKADYNRYIELYAPAFRQSILEKWGNKIIAFRSLMDVVH